MKQPSPIPATKEQYRRLREDIVRRADHREHICDITTSLMLLSGIAAVLVAVILLTLASSITAKAITTDFAVLTAGFLLMIGSLLPMEHGSAYRRRTTEAFDTSAASAFWKEMCDAESCRRIGENRKRQGLDPTDDTYYERLARYHEDRARKIAEQHQNNTPGK